MKIYVCWSTRAKYVNHDHPCGIAYHAVTDAGYDPEVVKAKGWKLLPDMPFNQTKGREEVKELTGQVDVPILVLDDGSVIEGWRQIVDWAEKNPASAAAPAA